MVILTKKKNVSNSRNKINLKSRSKSQSMRKFRSIFSSKSKKNVKIKKNRKTKKNMKGGAGGKNDQAHESKTRENFDKKLTKMFIHKKNENPKISYGPNTHVRNATSQWNAVIAKSKSDNQHSKTNFLRENSPVANLYFRTAVPFNEVHNKPNGISRRNKYPVKGNYGDIFNLIIRDQLRNTYERNKENPIRKLYSKSLSQEVFDAHANKGNFEFGENPSSGKIFSSTRIKTHLANRKL